jgi:nicotinate phosphoribosyltransferase
MVAVQNKNGEWEPRMKCSNTIAKAIIPGYKKVYRLYDSEGKSCMDVISMYDEELKPKEGEPIKSIKGHNTDVYDTNPEYVITPAKIEPLLVPFIVDGKLVTKLPSIPEIRSKVKWQLENEVWPTQRRLANPSKYRVCTTDRVYKLQNDMYYSLHTKYNKVI